MTTRARWSFAMKRNLSVCYIIETTVRLIHLIHRGCASKDVFEKVKRECDDTTILGGSEYTVAMCEESGCKAELPKSAISLNKKSTRVHNTLASRKYDQRRVIKF